MKNNYSLSCIFLVLLTLLTQPVLSSDSVQAIFTNSTIYLDDNCEKYDVATFGGLLFVWGGFCPGSNSYSTQLGILNLTSNEWDMKKLPSSRFESTILSLGDVVYFAGGFTDDGSIDHTSQTTEINVYNLTTNQFQSSLTLVGGARGGMGGVSIPDKNLLVFAGGYTYNRFKFEWNFTNTVEIHRIDPHIVTTYQLSQERSYPVVAWVRDLVLIIGGVNFESQNLTTVDIINTTDNSIRPLSLSSRSGQSAVAVVKHLVLCGGRSVGGNFVVDILDVNMETFQWTTISLTVSHRDPRYWIMANALADRWAIFLFSLDQTQETTMQVYDIKTKNWTSNNLTSPLAFERVVAFDENRNAMYVKDHIMKTIAFIAPQNDSIGETEDSPVNYIESMSRIEDNQNVLIYIIAPIAAVFALVGILVLLIIARRNNQLIKESKSLEDGFGMKPHGFNISNHIDEIEIEGLIGKGFFGEVYKATMNGTTLVAAKRIFTDIDTAFDSETKILMDLKHPNIVMYLGTCTSQGIRYMVTEYISNGNLQAHFSENRTNGLPLTDFLLIAKGILAGMAYLEANRIIHRDLALRNILFLRLAGDQKYQVKVADFGLSRVLNHDYYAMSQKSRIPLRWASPESLKEGKFSVKSDIWSFGVVLWEMFTFGQVPYGNLVDERAGDEIRKGNTLSIPSNCPTSVRNIISSCWDLDPKKRPNFQELFASIEGIFRELSKEELEAMVMFVDDYTGDESVDSDYSLHTSSSSCSSYSDDVAML